MDGSVVQTWMSDILHAVTQGLLVPDIILLVLFMGYALFCIGSIISEFFTERKHFKAEMPKFLAALMAAEEDGIPVVIEESGLLKRQKVALLTVYDYRMLPGDALIALIKRLVSEEESRYDRISGRNNMAARVSPMLGLMGTLIPLGPGIQALGSANTELLSASLLIAFDTTVAGLVTAAVCMVVGKIRSIWYGNYMSALDSAMATMLQKIEDMRAEGKIVIQEPSDYAFLFEQAGASKQAEGSTDKPKRRKGGKAESGQAVAARGASIPMPAPAPKPTPTPMPTPKPAPASVTTPTSSAPTQASAPMQSSVTAGGMPSGGSISDRLSRINAEISAELPATPPTASQSSSLSPVKPLDSLAYEPARTYGQNASFAPVPDPAFISDLASAAATNPAPAPAEEPLPTSPSGFSFPFDPSQGHQATGWYQPQLRADENAGKPYAPNGDYPADVPYQNR